MEEKISLGILYIAILAYTSGVITSLMQKNPFVSGIFIVYILLMVFMIYLARFRKRFFYFTALILSILPIYSLWFLNGGLSGGTPYFLFFPAILAPILVKKWKGKFILWISLVSIALLTMIEYFYPSLIVQHLSRELRFIDLITTAVISILAAYAISKNVVWEYNYQKDRADQLLLNILPKKIADELLETGKTTPTLYPEVTILFSDFENFTQLSSDLSPESLIGELNELFTGFDSIIETYDCQRIKTIGDAYLCVCGMPEQDKAHGVKIMKCAQEMIAFLQQRNRTTGIQWKARIGVHSGEVVAGIVGTKKYFYDIFGDSVNTASRMEHNSESMRINVSETTRDLVASQFEFEPGRMVEVKGKGLMKLFFLKN